MEKEKDNEEAESQSQTGIRNHIVMVRHVRRMCCDAASGRYDHAGGGVMASKMDGDDNGVSGAEGSG